MLLIPGIRCEDGDDFIVVASTKHGIELDVQKQLVNNKVIEFLSKYSQTNRALFF